MARKKSSSPEDPALVRVGAVLERGGVPEGDLFAEYAALADSYRKLLRKFHKTLVISDSYEAERQEILEKLEETTQKYRQLKDVALPICMYCKKIRSDDDYWHRLENFFLSHADIMFSHGICPDCARNAYQQMGLTGRMQASARTAERRQAARGTPAAEEDDALREMRSLARQRAFDGDPLPQEMEGFIEKYGKLLRRFNKIVSISDSYQSQLMELNSRLELMARTDLLTGLANRWEMVARMDAEKSRMDRHGNPFSILLADIDRFKSINDTHGHLAGDRVLRIVADTIRTSTRREDICGRWGGEEFLMVLPETDLNQARATAEKILKTVRDTSIPWEERTLGVTLSIGYGTITSGTAVIDFMKKLDEALYRAKGTGRDRTAPVEMLTPPDHP